MAYIVMAYTAVAYEIMVYMVMACIVVAFIVVWATTFLTSEILKERIVRSKIELQRVLDKEGRGAHVCSIHGISTDQSCKCREQDLEEWINDWNKLKRLGKAWRSKAEEKERQVAMEE